MSLNRRVVKQIGEYPEPKEIYRQITQKEFPYSPRYREKRVCRDRTMMSTAFLTASRIVAIVGGRKYSTAREAKEIAGEPCCTICGRPLRRLQIKYCSRKCAIESSSVRHRRIVGHYRGLCRENLTVEEDCINFNGMEVAKRSQKVVEKYGEAVSRREHFMVPLECGLFTNPFWDQLTPFANLLLEYLVKYAPKKGNLFHVSPWRAWKIVNKVTGWYPNWFRAQSEHFYGTYLLDDMVKLARFIKVVNPLQVAHYVGGQSWKSQLKDKERAMSFKWIDEEVTKIQDQIRR